MDATHLDPRPIGQHRHPHRVRAPAADHHPDAPVTVLLQVRAQDLVRVVMMPRNQPLEIFLTHRTLEFDWCTHDRSIRDQAPLWVARPVARHITRAPELSIAQAFHNTAALSRCWLTERSVDPMNVATPHHLGGKIPTKTTPTASSRSKPPLFNNTDRLDTTKRSILSGLPCILAVNMTRKQGRKSLRLTQRPTNAQKNATPWRHCCALHR